MDQNIMPWLDLLPEVGAPLIIRREAIARKTAEAERLEAQAAELRAEAYRDALALESTARGLWTADQIDAAKRRTMRQVTH
jgi:transposase InsO family protein